MITNATLPALQQAIEDGSLNQVKQILESKPGQALGLTDSDVLLQATHTGQMDIALYLVMHHGHRLDLERRDASNNTALGWAIYHGHLPLVQQLVAHNISLDVIMERGFTPFGLSIALDKEAIFLFLLPRISTATLNRPEASGKTPLLVAMEQEYQALRQHYPITKRLLQHAKVDLEHRDNLGNTAFSLAVERNLAEVVAIILQNNSDVVTLQLGKAVCSAIEHNNDKIIYVLLAFCLANEILCTPNTIAKINGLSPDFWAPLIRMLSEGGIPDIQELGLDALSTSKGLPPQLAQALTSSQNYAYQLNEAIQQLSGYGYQVTDKQVIQFKKMFVRYQNSLMYLKRLAQPQPKARSSQMTPTANPAKAVSNPPLASAPPQSIIPNDFPDVVYDDAACQRQLGQRAETLANLINSNWSDVLAESENKIDDLEARQLQQAIEASKRLQQEAETAAKAKADTERQSLTKVIKLFLAPSQDYQETRYNLDDLSAPNENQSTPLMLAVRKGNVSVVEALLKIGVDTSVINKLGHTAFQLAQRLPDSCCQKKLIIHVFERYDDAAALAATRKASPKAAGDAALRPAPKRRKRVSLV